MNQIINIRGANGSGKTTLVRRFLQKLPHEPKGRGRKPIGYKVDATAWGIYPPVFVVGAYPDGVASGGLDGINTKEEATELIVSAAEHGHVLCEGVLLSTTGVTGYTPPILHSMGAIFGVLDTPWETCVARVLARRAAASNNKPFDPERSMRRTFSSVASATRKMQAADYDVRTIQHDNDPVGTVVGWLAAAEQQRALCPMHALPQGG